MRTTMTLEKDVASRLDRLARRRGQSMKSLVNEALRAGLAQIEQPAAPKPAFRTAGFDLGPSLVGSLDDVEGVLARVEGESHR
ncbi:MAG: ribbon-helix-helix domain-containing protein [Acidobacteriota bacterium]|nr:ribbon-helix-helix domain-containing protein [Acidobacteriota bacterium]